MLLRLDKVAKFYGRKIIFKGVSLELEAGRILLLCGANGAGKSTLLKIMAGLIRPDAGRAAHTLTTNGRLGYMGHQTFIYPAMNALENLRFWAGMHGLEYRASDLAALLQRVNLLPFAAEKAGAFSRGMAQRLNLARILLLEPELLLLDEPATGMDAPSRAMLEAEIIAAAARGAGIVWISHSLEADLPRAHQAALLEGGRLAFLGSATDYARLLTGAGA
ncbi:MAG: ATP-binding cassette domain-containing protein [Deltaproteobacteria bacterium]|jgi:heme exporter protein A|nr:ATP-binding cassette domain-containing protein [Deltaproteobacteria bacterium]